jgi:hypothetical protein
VTLQMPTEIAKVKIGSDGEIYFNDRIVAIDDLKAELKRLSKINGAVAFTENTSSEFSRQQSAAVKKDIIDAHLPIQIK